LLLDKNPILKKSKNLNLFNLPHHGCAELFITVTNLGSVVVNKRAQQAQGGRFEPCRGMGVTPRKPGFRGSKRKTLRGENEHCSGTRSQKKTPKQTTKAIEG